MLKTTNCQCDRLNIFIKLPLITFVIVKSSFLVILCLQGSWHGIKA